MFIKFKVRMNPQNYMTYRDLQYEQENIGYDWQYPTGGIKCKNYELCDSVLPTDHYEHHANYLCMGCGSWFPKKYGGHGWNELEFRQSAEECAVCHETCERQLKFPANCGHWFCISCSKEILFWQESRYHISPVLFGCPPCPNGCVNPEKGNQCNCEEYDEIQEKWRQQNPLKLEEFADALDLSINSSLNNESVYGSQKCPLCRKKYERVQ
jgi:hypothetical protein